MRVGSCLEYLSLTKKRGKVEFIWYFLQKRMLVPYCAYY